MFSECVSLIMCDICTLRRLFQDVNIPQHQEVGNVHSNSG